MMKFLYSFQSEWLKTKRSAVGWLSFIGGFFIPLVFLIAYLKEHESFAILYPQDPFAWHKHFMKIWNISIALLFPMAGILAISLIMQLENKNNTWKQLHTTPQNFRTIFFAKFSVIILMMLQFFVCFNIGILLAAFIPCLIFEKHFPEQAIPYLFFFKQNIKFFITSLPIVAFQYLLSLKFKNIMVSIGVGVLFLIGTMLCFSWKYIFISPFAYNVMITAPGKKTGLITNMFILSFCLFLLIMIINYYLYKNKKEKG